MAKQCKYDRWRALPAGRELDEVIQREACRYPERKVAPKWSTEPRLIHSLIGHLREYKTSCLTLSLSPMRNWEGDTVDPGIPLYRDRWEVEHDFPGWPGGSAGGISLEPFAQEGEGETLNLALCRALLHIDCECDGPECQ